MQKLTCQAPAALITAEPVPPMAAARPPGQSPD